MEIYNNVFSDIDFTEILKTMAEPKWMYGHGSVSPTSGIPFWQMELSDSEFFNDYLLNIIRDVTDEPDLVLERVYANGHVFADKALPHIDGHYDDCRTFLLYSNPEWNHLWGGKTCFFNRDNTYTYVNPEPNKAVFFPGQRKHYAEEVSRTFTSLRTTIAWKLNGAKRELRY